MATELIKDLIGVLGAAIALASAWIGYRTVKKKAVTSPKATHTVLKIEDTSVRQQPWSMRRYKWLGALGAIPALIIGISATIFEELDSGLAILNLSIGIGLIVLIALLRTEPPSRTRKFINVEVLLPVVKAMEVCLESITSLGAQVAKYSAEDGILIAKNGMSWRSFGEIITVKAVQVNPDRCQISIESDVLQATVLLDWGANRRNVRHIQSSLIHMGSSTE